ncbi:MAG: nucleotidyltransferase family protein, partial [Clostridia bacterium]|nr:nucleotidyltransferase family protein [Clostridia bacterium]
MNSFTLTEEILLELLSSTINGRTAQIDEEKLKQIDWNKIGWLSSKHAVRLAVFDAVLPCKKYISSDVYDKWYTYVLKELSNNWRLGTAQKQLHEEICGDCDYVVLKGVSAAQYYWRPDLRTLGDIDFLIDPERLEEVSKKIIACGYEKHSENDCHICFLKNDVAIEMHYEIPGIPYGKAGEKVRGFVKNILQDTKTVTHGGNVFSSPSDMFNGVILLLHMQHHMVSEGIGLRH